MAEAEDTPEIWKVIPSFPRFEASSLGRIRRADDHSIKKQYLKDTGYFVVSFWTPERSLKRLVSRLVCEAFHGPPPKPSSEAAHWDGDSRNNIFSNLRWASSGENGRDKSRHGRLKGSRPNLRGSAHGRATITEEVAFAIRNAPSRRGFRKALIEKYGVTESVIKGIRRRDRNLWPHVPWPD